MDPDRVLRSFIDDGPMIGASHVQALVGDEVRRTRQRGGAAAGGSNLRRRLLMAWPAGVLLVVVGIAAAGGVTAPEEAVTSSPAAAIPATIAPVAAAVAVPSPALAAPAAASTDGTARNGAAANDIAANGTATATGAGAADASVTAAGVGVAPWIAYSFNDRIRLVRADGSDDHVVVADIGLRQRGASWSRDGRLAFEADFGVGSQLWVAEADGTGATPLTDIDLACTSACAFATDAAWSGDGSAVAYVRRTVTAGRVASNELVVIDLEDRTSRTLLADDAHLLRLPSWEPNGHRIVVERDGGAAAMRGDARATELVMVDARDAHPTAVRVPGTDTGAREPSWGSNGLIAYATDRDGSALITVDPDSGLALTLLAFPRGAERVTAPAWWPDGEGLLYGRLAPGAVVPVVRSLDLQTRLDRSATGGETAVGFDPDLRRATP